MIHPNRKLGKRPAKRDPRTLRLARYTTKLAPAPLVWDQAAKAAPKFGMMLNDQLGDCTIAAVGHQQQVWTAQTAAEFTPADAQILAAYEAIGGYRPGEPSTDQGCAMLDVLNYWRKHGLFGHPLGAFVAVNPTRRQEVMDAIYYFGGLYTGLELPNSAASQTDWTVATGPDSIAGSWGGHAVTVPKYAFPAAAPNTHTPRTLTCITWGTELEMTWQFFATYCDEAYALLSADWLESDGKCPEGFDLAALKADLQALESA